MSKIEDKLCEEIQRRAQLGLKKYGVTMERTDLNDLVWLCHARDEAMDLCVYLTRLISDKEKELGFKNDYN